MSTKNSKFRKGSGAYTCASCNKLTRETGGGESFVGLCLHCYEVGGWANSILDGDVEIEGVPEKYRADVKRDLGIE